MSRTVKIVECHRNPAIIDEQIRNILVNDGYKLINYNDEMVWKMGTGLMTAMHYIKFEFSDNVLCISGWVQGGTGSVVGGKEHDLTGFTAAIPKKSVAKTMTKIEAVATQ